jgi:hypothetical protein
MQLLTATLLALALSGPRPASRVYSARSELRHAGSVVSLWCAWSSKSVYVEARVEPLGSPKTLVAGQAFDRSDRVIRWDVTRRERRCEFWAGEPLGMGPAGRLGNLSPWDHCDPDTAQEVEAPVDGTKEYERSKVAGSDGLAVKERWSKNGKLLKTVVTETSGDTRTTVYFYREPPEGVFDGEHNPARYCSLEDGLSGADPSIQGGPSGEGVEAREALPNRKSAEAAFREGRVAEARADWAPCVRLMAESGCLDPSFAPAFRGLGLCQMRSGDPIGTYCAYQR